MERWVSHYESRGISSGQLLWGGNLRFGMACLLPGGRRCLLVRLGEQVVHLEVDTVGPAEADDIALVTCGNFYVGGATDDVLLFGGGAVSHEVLADRLCYSSS